MRLHPPRQTWNAGVLPGLLALATVSCSFAQPAPIDVMRERERVLQLLETYGKTDGVLSGQNAGHADNQPQAGYERFLATLGAETGQVPAILSSLSDAVAELSGVVMSSHWPPTSSVASLLSGGPG